MFSMSLTQWTARNILLRIMASMCLGALIGIDRGVKRRGGGARMDAVVCMGATMVMLTAQYVHIAFGGSGDIARLGAQVISGIGFLGAGSIIVSGHQVKGLTSAASVWFCACIGLASGIGFVDGAVLVTVILLGGLHIIPWIEENIYRHSRYVILSVEAVDGRTLSLFTRKLKEDGCKIDIYDMDKPKVVGNFYTIQTTIRIPLALNKEAYLQELSQVEGIIFFDVL